MKKKVFWLLIISFIALLCWLWIPFIAREYDRDIRATIDNAHYYYTIFTNKSYYKMLEIDVDTGNKVLVGYKDTMKLSVMFTPSEEEYLWNHNIDFECLTISQALQGCFTNEWNIMWENK